MTSFTLHVLASPPNLYKRFSDNIHTACCKQERHYLHNDNHPVWPLMDSPGGNLMQILKTLPRGWELLDPRLWYPEFQKKAFCFGVVCMFYHVFLFTFFRFYLSLLFRLFSLIFLLLLCSLFFLFISLSFRVFNSCSYSDLCWKQWFGKETLKIAKHGL